MTDQKSSETFRRIVALGIIGLIVLVAVLAAVSFFFASRPVGPPYDSSSFFFPFRFGWLGGIFLILIALWVARWLLWPRRGGCYYVTSQHQNKADAESIVRERYAKGEITKEQFEQMLHDLRQQEKNG